MFDEITHVYRCQNAMGRGPFQKGLTDLWRDPTNEPPHPMDFDRMREVFDQANALGLHHFGFACRTPEQLKQWFWASEWPNLTMMGFFPYRIAVVRPLMESPHEVLFARRWPLTDGTTGVERIGL